MRKPRAIVCDDEDSIRYTFKQILEEEGYEVLTADTPITCVFYREQVDNCPMHGRCTDILITDQEMPGMSGIQLLEMQHNRGCKVANKNKVLLSGREDSTLRQRAEALGCQFFPKPVLISTILAWIKEREGDLDLSEPLASELFLPAKDKTFRVFPLNE